MDSDGNDIEFQFVRAPYIDGRHVNMCMFKVQIPTYGYGTYFIYKDEQNYKPEKRENQFIVSENFIDNGLVRVEFNQDGDVKSYFNKINGKEYCSAPMRAVVCEDKESDTWGHSVFDFNKDIGEFGNAKLEIIESGTLRAVVKATSMYNDSVLVRYYTLYKDSPKLEVKCKIKFREEFKILKLTFPIEVNNPKAIYSMPYGFIEKATDGLEEPAQKWISTDGDDGGVSLINDGRYSFCVKGNEMRMIAARTCAYLDHYGQCQRDRELDFIDMDELELTYSLFYHDSGDFVGTVKEAELLNMPLQLYMETHHKGSLPTVYSGIEVDCDNVLVTVVKESEDGKGYVIRAVECTGKSSMAKFDFKLIGRKFDLDFKPQEIKTIYIPKESGNIKEIMITED